MLYVSVSAGISLHQASSFLLKVFVAFFDSITIIGLDSSEYVNVILLEVSDCIAEIATDIGRKLVKGRATCKTTLQF